MLSNHVEKWFHIHKSGVSHHSASLLPDIWFCFLFFVWLLVFLSWQAQHSQIGPSGSSCLRFKQAKCSSIKWPESVLGPVFAVISIFHCATWCHACYTSSDVIRLVVVLSLFFSFDLLLVEIHLSLLQLYQTENNTHLFLSKDLLICPFITVLFIVNISHTVNHSSPPLPSYPSSLTMRWTATCWPARWPLPVLPSHWWGCRIQSLRLQHPTPSPSPTLTHTQLFFVLTRPVWVWAAEWHQVLDLVLL